MKTSKGQFSTETVALLRDGFAKYGCLRPRRLTYILAPSVDAPDFTQKIMVASGFLNHIIRCHARV